MPREGGQGLVEYALILALVAIIVLAVLTLLGPAVGNVFSNVVSSI
jgi:pilus assembly protein Flp/PilA